MYNQRVTVTPVQNMLRNTTKDTCEVHITREMKILYLLPGFYITLAEESFWLLRLWKTPRVHILSIGKRVIVNFEITEIPPGNGD